MEHDRGELIRSVFLEALGLQAPERSLLLDERCSGDSELRREVESLLAHDVHGSPFLESPAVYLPTPLERLSLVDPPRLENPGDQVGAYRLVRVVGEGTFGTVWLAERQAPFVQTVALKIIKPGMDSRAVVTRFEQERQSLAVMDHPNIARVMDGGRTPHGRPYFVMEYVEGEPITSYADRNGLVIAERLKLFAPVCEAVQHAHSKGIIHRDLKPTNILVAEKDGVAAPKVIDFGVAKSVNPSQRLGTMFTEQGQMIGTPEYMSPEQASGGTVDIDTRTDVYALGVILCELLTGKLPFNSRALRSAARDEVQRIIREVEPAKPSTRVTENDSGAAAGLRPDDRPVSHSSAMLSPHFDPTALSRQLRGDLDWVVMKCLDKDRARRYATPTALSDELARFIRGDPVQAGPPSTTYRLQKFVQRNRGPVIATIAAMLGLLMGMVGTTWGFLAARQMAKRERVAKVDADDKRKIAETKTAEAEEATQTAVAARNETQYRSYVANVEMAAAAMDFRQFDRVRQRLDACTESLRDWEWRWLNASADTSLFVLQHSAYVTSASFDPDGKRVVLGLGDNTVCVWDAIAGKLLFEFKAHEGAVTGVSFSLDGARLVTSSDDSTAGVWDATTGTRLATLQGHAGSVKCAAFNREGTQIVTGSDDGTARVWNLATGQTLVYLKGHKMRVTSASFSPDGTKIVTASDDGTARVWNVATGTSVVELRTDGSYVQCASFSPDASRIVTASSDSIVRVWDAVTGNGLLQLAGHTNAVNSALFSSDGTQIVTSSDDMTALVWDAIGGQRLAELRGHTSRVTSASFSPNGTQIITASSDNTARMWNAVTKTKPNDVMWHTAAVTSASFSSDGTWIVMTSDDGTARTINASTGQTFRELVGHTSGVCSASFSSDDKRILTSSFDNTSRVWNSATGESIFELTGHTERVTCAAFSADDSRIVTASFDYSTRVWDSATGKCIMKLIGHEGVVNSASFSRDGTRIVTASGDSTARVWDTLTGYRLAVLTGHSGYVTSASFSPDGTKIVTSSGDKTACLWDAATGTHLLT